MRDEKKRLGAIILERRQGMKCATRASEELTSAIKVEAAELRSKVEMLEGELRELKLFERGRARVGEGLTSEPEQKRINR